LAGIPGVTYVIEACEIPSSQSLVEIGQALVGADGSAQFADTDAGSH
jgi:hypothetical protein